MTTRSTKHASSTAPASESFRAHFEQVRAECEALDPSQFVQISLDVTSAVATALGALPGIRALRDRMARLPETDISRIDKLETYARAAHYTHGAYLAAAEAPDELPAISEQGVTLRATLLTAADALAAKKLLSGTRLAEIRAGVGYRDLASDLVSLAAMFTAAWPAIANRTAVEPADLVEAETLASRILVALGARDHASATETQASSDRQRAVSLFVRTYDQVARALTYLRWDEDDAERIAPSLYNRGTPRRKTAPAVAPVEPPTPVVLAAPTDSSHRG